MSNYQSFLSTRKAVEKVVRHHLRNPKAADAPFNIRFTARDRPDRDINIMLVPQHHGAHKYYRLVRTSRSEGVQVPRVNANEKSLTHAILDALARPENYRPTSGHVGGRRFGSTHGTLDLSARAARRHKRDMAELLKQADRLLRGRNHTHVAPNLHWEDPVTYEPVPKTNAYYIRQNAAGTPVRTPIGTPIGSPVRTPIGSPAGSPAVRHVYSKNTLLRLLAAGNGAKSPMTRAAFGPANVLPVRVQVSKAERRGAKVARRLEESFHAASNASTASRT